MPSAGMLASQPSSDFLLDAGEANCTQLVMLIFDQMKLMTPGQVLEVVGYDPSGTVDIMAWCRLTKNPLLYWAKPECAGMPSHYFIQKAFQDNPKEGSTHG